MPQIKSTIETNKSGSKLSENEEFPGSRYSSKIQSQSNKRNIQINKTIQEQVKFTIQKEPEMNIPESGLLSSNDTAH